MDGLAQRLEGRRATVEHPDRRVPAADAADRAVAEHVVESREQRGQHSPVARRRVGDHRADLDLAGRGEHLRVHDEGLLPQQRRVEGPRVGEPVGLGQARQLDDARRRRVVLQDDSELHG